MRSPQIYGVALLFFLCAASASPALPAKAARTSALPSAVTSSSSQVINSNSVLVALLDSQYTELAELVEKALLLPTLEDAVGRHNLTILAPRNEALERDLDPGFRRFLLEPGNLHSLQTLLLSHVLPSRIDAAAWPRSSSGRHHRSINHDHDLHLRFGKPRLADEATSAVVPAVRMVDLAAVVHPDAIVRPDGIIHGVDRLLVPRSVQEDFNRRRSLVSISAVHPMGAPEVDPRTHRLKHPAPPAPAGSPPALPISDAMAPGPALAPASAPGPGGPNGHFNGMQQVKDFIHTLLQYGGYNEMADILVNLTSLATEMGRLVSEGYVLTVLAPNDEAMTQLTADQLSEPGAPEQIMYYHLIPEYQTEESMYNAVRRFGKVRYDTLHFPHKVIAREADGSVKFGQGEGSAYLFDPDIYTDGRISVQGIDKVLLPPEELAPSSSTTASAVKKPGSKPADNQRRGKLMELACGFLGALGQSSRLSPCQRHQ